MLAPRRRPPCLTTSVVTSKIRMKPTGPEATRPVLRTWSPRGRRWVKVKPVPPPVWWMRDMSRTASMMLRMSSKTGMTKQAANWPRARPAFIRVGVLGKNLRDARAS